MALPIKKNREIIFQLLFSSDTGKPAEEDMIPLIMKQLSVTKRAVKEAQEKVSQIQAKLPAIDQLISNTSTSYSFERIQNVERNILRLGVYEMVFEQDTPPKVVISEAIRLARKFGTPESAAFINALLDNIYKHSAGLTIDPNLVSNASQVLLESETTISELAKQEPLIIDDEESNSQ